MSIPSCFHRHNPSEMKTKKTITGPNPLTCRHWCYMTARPTCQHRAPWTTTHRWTHEHLTDTNRLLFQSYACTHGRFQGEPLPHRPAEEGREACVLFLVRINILDAGQTNNMSAWDGSCSSLYCEMACGCSRASTTLPERLQEDWARVAILPPRFDFQVETSDYFMHLLFWIVF